MSSLPSRTSARPPVHGAGRSAGVTPLSARPPPLPPHNAITNGFGSTKTDLCTAHGTPNCYNRALPPRRAPAYNRPMRTLLTATLCLALIACADDPALTIRLQTPASLAGLSTARGALKVALLDGNTGLEVVSATPAPASLADRQRLFSQLDLVEDRLFRVRVTLTLEPKDSTCDGGRRVVGQSPVFRFNKEMGHISVYIACADRFGQVESLKRERLYHTATFLPTPRPHGQVLVVGGGKLNLSDPEAAYKEDDLRASIEAFDPDTGTFRLLSDPLSQARLYHRATAINDTTVLITGGASVATGTLKPVRLVERLRNSAVTGLHSMNDTRAFHTAELLTPSTLLLSGGLSAEKGMLKTAELFDTETHAQKPMAATPTFHRTSAASVTYAGGDKVLIFGGRYSDGLGKFDEIFCNGDTCPCGKGPCFHTIATGVATRSGATGTRVSCGGAKEAIFFAGGYYKIPNTKIDHYYDDILCFDTATSTYSLVGKLRSGRTLHTATLIRGPKKTQRLLVAGGSTKGSKVLRTAELFEVSCDCKAPILPNKILVLNMRSERRVAHQATLLADGTVLLTGGALTNSVERFMPELE